MVCISGITFDPNPSRVLAPFRRVRTKLRQVLSVDTASQKTVPGHIRRSYTWFRGKVNKLLSLGRVLPKSNERRFYVRYGGRIHQVLSRLAPKSSTRKLNNLGTVLGFAKQNIGS